MVGEPLLRTLGWVTGIIIVFGTLAVRLYRRSE